MAKPLNILSKELYELRVFICDEEPRIKTLEYEMSKVMITEKWLYVKLLRKEELTDEEDKLNKETIIIRNKIGSDYNHLEFRKRQLEALKKYI